MQRVDCAMPLTLYSTEDGSCLLLYSSSSKYDFGYAVENLPPLVPLKAPFDTLYASAAGVCLALKMVQSRSDLGLALEKAPPVVDGRFGE